MLNMIIILFFASVSFANQSCKLMFIQSPRQIFTSQDEQNALESLVRLQIQIETNQFQSVGEKQAAKDKFSIEIEKAYEKFIDFKTKYQNVYKRLKASATQQEKLEDEQRKKEEEKRIREEILRDQSNPINHGRKLVFHQIFPGEFQMLNPKGAPDKTSKVTISKAFELAQTLTTQLQWSVIQVLLGKTEANLINPANFKSGDDVFILKIHGIEVTMQPDHPIENVSHNDVTDWITGLNQLSINGNEQTQKEIQKVIPTHQKGMVYDLPTRAQWLFVMQNRGRNNEVHFDKGKEVEENQFDSNIEKVLDLYAWSQVNSNRKTHPVATKLPRKIDQGNGVLVDFYDLEGNVSEWNKDGTEGYDYVLPGGVDPIGPTGEAPRVVSGGNWLYAYSFLRANETLSYYPTVDSSSVGFRLLRTVK
jgi:formylglycine-generating enzyme required for sulfatase activity